MKSVTVRLAGGAVLGLLSLAAGIVMTIVIDNREGVMLSLPYVLIGVGCGGFGYSGSLLIQRRLMERNSKLAKAIRIEATDERNQMITVRAKARAYDLMLFVFSSLILVLVLMRADVLHTLLLVAAYLIVVFSFIYYMYRLDKEM